jgi:hypothetical protein
MKTCRDEQQFAYMLIEQRKHAPEIEFELTNHSWDRVRLAFELVGYSVHVASDEPSKVVAYRVDPDRAPVNALMM